MVYKGSPTLLSHLVLLGTLLIGVVHPRPLSWIPRLNLTWARSNLGSQITCMVGFEFPAPSDSR